MDLNKAVKIIGFFLISAILVLLCFWCDAKFWGAVFPSGISLLLINPIIRFAGEYTPVYLLIILIGIGILLTEIKNFDKVFISIGLLIILFFSPVLIEFYGFIDLSGGEYGRLVFAKISGFPVLFQVILLFFAFLTAFLSLLFPYRKSIAIAVYSIFSGFVQHQDKTDTKRRGIKPQVTGTRSPVINKAGDSPVKAVKSDIRQKTPWLTKVIYDERKRVEIPIASNNRIRKFSLNSSSDDTDYYDEVKTFSEKDSSNNNSIISSSNQSAGYNSNISVNNNDQQLKIEEYFEKTKLLWDTMKKKDGIEESTDIIEAEFVYDEDDAEDFELIESEVIQQEDSYIDEAESDSVIEDEIVESDTEESVDITDITENAGTAPSKSILQDNKNYSYEEFKAEENESALILENTLQEFDIKAEVTEIIHGPVVTLFKLNPAPGIKLSRIENLSNNLALRLGAKSIRIIAPIPGEKSVGVEIPNRLREVVGFREIVDSENFTNSKFHIPVGLGKDIYGKIIIIDVYKMPHILIAGATGSGKSVCVNVFISSILFSCSPDKVKLLLIDPKIVELKPYNDIPHLLTPVITDSKKAINALKYLVYEMERRYSVLDTLGARDIVEYNHNVSKRSEVHEKLPFIVAVVDEFADLISVAGKEAEGLFARLTAKARAVGIHMLLATQRPSIDVITGLIKANVPTRIAFQVISLQDSRIILDQKGAEKLLGQGDMLYLSPAQPFTIRLQGAFLSKEEVDKITDHWKSVGEPNYINIEEELGILENDSDDSEGDEDLNDPLFKEAIDIVYRSQKASASYLQRKLNIGYNRAARMVEEMERMGLVGPQRGSKPREIISSGDEF